MNENITNSIVRATQEICGNKKQNKFEKLSMETKALTDRRRNMKTNAAGKEMEEYQETCRKMCKRIRKDTRLFNSNLIKATIEKYKSINQ